MTATAHASWRPTPREQAALARQHHVQSLGQVDLVWPWLADHHGEVLAVDAPHAAHPERLPIELADRIAKVAAAFRNFGIATGDVVSLFAENSPRWLVVIRG